MPESLTGKSCTGFVQALASREPVPGGGGAAALAGALGAALCSMAGNFSVKREIEISRQKELEFILTQCEGIQNRLLKLIEEDAAGFAPLAKAYAIPKTDPERSQKLEAATRTACQAPLHMMHACCEAIELLAHMLELSSQPLISDVGCGAILCRAALESASLNVYVNTRTLQDRAAAEQLENETNQLLSQYCRIADEVIRTVFCRLQAERLPESKEQGHADAKPR